MKNAVLAIPHFVLRHRNFIVEVICFLFILLLFYAAGSKVLDTQKFSAQIGQSPLLEHMAGFVAWFIPLVEILTCILLAIPKYRLLGLYSALGLMAMFSAYIIAILNFSTKIPCSCGGVLEIMGWKEHLVFNLVFVTLAAIGVWLQSGSRPDTGNDSLSIGEASSL